MNLFLSGIMALASFGRAPTITPRPAPQGADTGEGQGDRTDGDTQRRPDRRPEPPGGEEAAWSFYRFL
jgi:hypothetical protein